MRRKVVEPTSILVATAAQFFSEDVVCSGAICVCTGNPSAFAELSITTHQKYYLNAVDKLIATVEDNQFKSGSSPFQQCKYKNGKDKTCTYQPFGVWKIENNASCPSIGGRGILTKAGTLPCTRGGTLSIRTSGQADDIEHNEMLKKRGSLSEVGSSTQAEGDLGECATQVRSYVTDINGLTLSNLEQLHYRQLIRDNPRALRVQKGDELIFTATTKAKEESKYISWSVLYAREGSKVLEEGKTGKTIQVHAFCDHFESYSTKHRAFSWQPQKKGVYLIAVTDIPQEGLSKTYNETFYYYLEVVDQATITSLQLSVDQEEELVVGDRVIIALHSDIKLSSEQLDQLHIKVSVENAHLENHTVFDYTSRGAYPFKQKGTTIQVIFDCVNVNAYQVEVYKNLVRQTAIPTQYFSVGSSSLLAVFPPVESVRIGSRIVFSAVLKSEEKMNPLLVRWRIKVPDSVVYQEHFVKDRTLALTFSKKGNYVIECVYDSLWTKKKSIQHTVRVVTNSLEEMTLLPCIVVDSLKGKKYKIRCYDRVTAVLGTTIGYQPPTTELAYVEVQTRDGSSVFTRIIQRVFFPSEKTMIRSRSTNTDTAIVWTLSYVKGPKKKVGFGLSIYYENPKTQAETLLNVRQLVLQEETNRFAAESSKPTSTYAIYTQTGRIVLRTNRDKIDFQFEEAGIYQLDVTLNHITKSYEIECVE